MKTQNIAMRCTQEQFEAIKPKLKELKDVKINVWGSFEQHNYLNYYNSKGEFVIGNYERYNLSETKNIHETWNEATFLKACGIEVDTFTVDKEFIKEAYDNPELLKEKFPSVFVSEPIELTMEQIAEKFNVDVNLLKIKK